MDSDRPAGRVSGHRRCRHDGGRSGHPLAPRLRPPSSATASTSRSGSRPESASSSSRSSSCVILFSLVKFRARADDDTNGPPIHGHTGLEIAWTAVPALLVTVIAIAAAIVLTQNSNAGSNPLRVNVLAQQFACQSSARTGRRRARAVPILRLPLDGTVELSLRSKDVIHSFSVPEFGQKMDALPWVDEFPHPTKLPITPTKVAQYSDHLHRALRPRPFADAVEGRRDARRRVRPVGEERAVSAGSSDPGSSAACGSSRSSSGSASGSWRSSVGSRVGTPSGSATSS